MRILWIILSFWLSFNVLSCKTKNEAVQTENSTEKENLTEPDLAMGEVQKAVQIKNILGRNYFGYRPYTITIQKRFLQLSELILRLKKKESSRFRVFAIKGQERII